jgi:class 3 adenylate cyclase
MNLRFKIFFWIGGLFFIGFMTAQIFEELSTSKALIIEEKNLQKTIIDQDELRRQNIERYVKSILDQEKEKMTVLFSKIQDYPWLYSRFAPTNENAENGTWLQAASLIDSNKWIDFIQNTNEGLLASQIIIDENFSKDVLLIEINRDVKLCVTRSLNSNGGWDGPYIAIPYDYEEVTYDTQVFPQESTVNPYQDNGYHLLFKPQILMNLKITDLNKRIAEANANWEKSGISFKATSNYAKIMKEMVSKIAVAQSYFKTNTKFYQDITTETRKDYIEKVLTNFKKECGEDDIANIDEGTKSLSRRFDQIVNIWELSTLLSLKIFGSEPFGPEFPAGICQIQEGSNCGFAFMNHDLLFDEMNVSTKKFQGRIGSLPEIAIVVYKDQADRLYFGGVLTLIKEYPNGDVRRGTLTLAIDARWIVRNLSLASNATSFFVSGGQVLTGYDSQGQKVNFTTPPFSPQKFLNQKTGFMEMNGEEYFYLLIKPYTDIDMNFFILSPKNKEFAFITILNSTAKSLIQQISYRTNLIMVVVLAIVLLILNNIVKHITSPISLLASACEDMIKGKLHDIQLPEMAKKQKDEVYTLYDAFRGMVAGLKEKEKVMGVLNKVVSPSIAQEILKGKVHLGGEEKVITVLFADIRNFTKLTEKMAPHDVILLLNTCMTKVSKTIDKYQGVIDKYVGDEVMALFGAPLYLENPPMNAIACALEIHQILAEWNKEREAKNLMKVEMGIGIHTGLVVAGNMGAENRLNYTVLGANVNLGARICSVAQPNEVIVTINTIQCPQILDRFEVEALPAVEFKGFSEPINIFKILGPKKPK